MQLNMNILLLSILSVAATVYSHGVRKSRSVNVGDINRIKLIFSRLMSWNNIPDEVVEWLTILNKHLYILSCLPTQKRGSCYQTPGYCIVDPIKVDGKPVKLQISICKSPVKIIIKYKIPLPTWAKLLLDVDLDPVVIPFDTNSRNGVTVVKSSSRAKVSVRGINFGIVKVSLIVDAMLRWDCTKPRGNLLTRLFYNMQYSDGKPGYDYNKVYYKLRVRVEFKVKKFPCFCYKCRKCEYLVNVKGDILEGPKSCTDTIVRALDAMKQGNPTKGRRVYAQRFQPRFPHCRLVPDKSTDLVHNVYLYYFLENPKKVQPGTKFVFAGIKKKRERVDLIAFVKNKRLQCPVE